MILLVWHLSGKRPFRSVGEACTTRSRGLIWADLELCLRTFLTRWYVFVRRGGLAVILIASGGRWKVRPRSCYLVGVNPLEGFGVYAVIGRKLVAPPIHVHSNDTYLDTNICQ
jgi:hypothetical protein